VEYIIVGVIVVVAGYILFSNIKNRSSGDCGCGNGCKGCNNSCEVKKPSKNDNEIE